MSVGMVICHWKCQSHFCSLWHHVTNYLGASHVHILRQNRWAMTLLLIPNHSTAWNKPSTLYNINYQLCTMLPKQPVNFNYISVLNKMACTYVKLGVLLLLVLFIILTLFIEIVYKFQSSARVKTSTWGSHVWSMPLKIMI